MEESSWSSPRGGGVGMGSSGGSSSSSSRWAWGDVDEELPGFRFHPTEEELIGFYLKNMVFGKKLRNDIIGLLNIYRHDPWELPGLAKIGEREWYFYVERDRSKQGSNGGRPNRITEHGFWKATGTDRKIFSTTSTSGDDHHHMSNKIIIGLKKTLVFYKGRAPRGSKTDWVMNEYRLPPPHHQSSSSSSPCRDIVLCKIYRKATSLKMLEQRAALDEIMRTNTNTSPYGEHNVPVPVPVPIPTTCDAPAIFCSHGSSRMSFLKKEHHDDDDDDDDDEKQQVVGGAALQDASEQLLQEVEVVNNNNNNNNIIIKSKSSSSSICSSTSLIKLPGGGDDGGMLGALQLPKLSINEMSWTSSSQDPLWSSTSHLRSPWLDNFFNNTPAPILTPTPPPPPHYSYYAMF